MSVRNFDAGARAALCSSRDTPSVAVVALEEHARMDLTVNFVWLGQGKLGWLECFIVYSWRMWGAKVNIFTQYPESELIHDHRSLGIPDKIATIYDLPTLVVSRDDDMQRTRAVLKKWFAVRIPTLSKQEEEECDLPAGRKRFIYNKVDLCKSFVAATTKGIVMDLKIGPSPHIHRFVERGVFSGFVGCSRDGTVENQLMGSMSESGLIRAQYGRAFENDFFKKCPFLKVLEAPLGEWFGNATIAHSLAMGSPDTKVTDSLKGAWFDVGKYGTADHDRAGIFNTSFKGIADEVESGAVRVFKREQDQTNKRGREPFLTTDKQREDIQKEAFWEMAQASLGSNSPVDVTVDGMPIKELLELLDLTKRR